MQIYINKAGGYLQVSATSRAKLDALRAHQGDRGTPAEVWLMEGVSAAEGSRMIGTAMPAPFTRLMVAARSRADLTEGSLLFSLTDFELAGSGETTHYVATFNGNTSAIAAKFPEANKTARTLDALVDIAMVDDAAEAEETLVRQQACIITRDIYRGTEGVPPDDGNPPYPVPSVIALRMVASKYRIKTDGTFQLWNADQAKYHTLTISGAAGAEVLNIGAGEV